MVMPTIGACRRNIAVAFLAVNVAGCAPEMAKLRQSIPHPGPAAYQRAQAIRHDPYLLDDVGPEVVGARPREYQRPLNEVERARLAAPAPIAMQPVPAPGVPIGPPAAVAPSYPGAPGTVVTTPAPPAAPTYPPASAPQATPFQYQQRAPY